MRWRFRLRKRRWEAWENGGGRRGEKEEGGPLWRREKAAERAQHSPPCVRLPLSHERPKHRAEPGSGPPPSPPTPPPPPPPDHHCHARRVLWRWSRKTRPDTELLWRRSARRLESRPHSDQPVRTTFCKIRELHQQKHFLKNKIFFF